MEKLTAMIPITTSIEELDFSIRARNCLIRGKCYTLADILIKGYSGIREIRWLGEKTAKEIGNKIAMCGYELDGFMEYEASRKLKKDATYKVYGYDKDNDTEVLFGSLAFYRDAVIVAKSAAMLIHLEMLRNTNGEPFDWVIIAAPDGSTQTVIYESKGEN